MTLLTAICITLPLMQSGSALSSAERALVSYVDAHNGEALALLERVVNINSGTQNFEGVREVGRVFRAELDALGFTTRWVDGAPFKRAGHLVAEHPAPGPRILLIGHLDTVFEKDSPFQKFQRIDDRTARGPGIIDMKGGDVIMIAALKALQASGALKTMNVVVVMTGDEEDAGEPLSLAREALVSAAKGAAIAIGFEDGPADPKLAVTARRGTTGWEVRVTGKPAHSSQIFRDDIGYGAIYELARIVNAFREKMAGEAHLTFNPGVMLGGTTVEFDPVQLRGTAFGKTNVIAEHAVASGDLRALSREQFAKARKTMQGIVAAIAAADAGHDQVRRGLSADGADGRERAAAGDVRPGQPRSRVRSGDRRQPGSRRRRRRVVRGGGDQDDHRRRRADGQRRSHGQRDRRPDDAAVADQAHGRAAAPNPRESSVGDRAVAQAFSRNVAQAFRPAIREHGQV